jgi:hypothetical protein
VGIGRGGGGLLSEGRIVAPVESTSAEHTTNAAT